MNEAKWDALLKYRNGRGMYYVMIFPYLFTLVIIFPLSIFWFDLINFQYRVMGSISIIILLTLAGIFKFSKLKDTIQEKYT